MQLVTRDAMGLYARYGFTAAVHHGEGPAERTVMVRDRRGAAGDGPERASIRP